MYSYKVYTYFRTYIKINMDTYTCMHLYLDLYIDATDITTFGKNQLLKSWKMKILS